MSINGGYPLTEPVRRLQQGSMKQHLAQQQATDRFRHRVLPEVDVGAGWEFYLGM